MGRPRGIVKGPHHLSRVVDPSDPGVGRARHIDRAEPKRCLSRASEWRRGRAGGTVTATGQQQRRDRCEAYERSSYCSHHMPPCSLRSEEHTSELQSHLNLVCRLLLEKKKEVTHCHTDNSSGQ